MKLLLGVLAVAMLATGFFANSADARSPDSRCWWNGHRRVCDYQRVRRPPPPRSWPHYPGWERHQWCYYHPGRCR